MRRARRSTTRSARPASERRSRRRRRVVRAGARARARAARRLLRARARAESAERGVAEDASRGAAKSRERPLLERQGCHGARRPRRRRASSSSKRFASTIAMRMRTTCSASFSASRASCPRRSAHLERATALQPFSADAHYNLGVALWYSAAKDRALTELKQSVVLDPACGACLRLPGHRAARRRRPADGAGQPAARHRGAAADRCRLRRSRHHIPSRRRAR